MGIYIYFFLRLVTAIKSLMTSNNEFGYIGDKTKEKTTTKEGRCRKIHFPPPTSIYLLKRKIQAIHDKK